VVLEMIEVAALDTSLDTPLDTPLETATEVPVVDETFVNADVAVLLVPDAAVPTPDDVAIEAVLVFPVAEKLAGAADTLLLPWSATKSGSAPCVSCGPVERRTRTRRRHCVGCSCTPRTAHRLCSS
jgi:hypothetical protein